MPELAAGPELDAAVAVVLGLPVVRGHLDRLGDGRIVGLRVDDAGPDVMLRAAVFGRATVAPIPPFSTDMRRAWEVVEWLRTHHWLVRVQEMPDGYPWLAAADIPESTFYAKAVCGLYWAPERTATDLRKRIRTHIWERGATSAEAICRAAISSVEEEARGYDYALFEPEGHTNA